MSQPSLKQILDLRRVADEFRATFSAEGYTVPKGLSANPVFTDGEGVRSKMIQKMAAAAARGGAGEVGLGAASVKGGGYELSGVDGNIYRHFRVRRVTEHDEDGHPVLMASSPSFLDFDGDSFMREEMFIFGYEVSSLETVDRVFIAEVLDVRGDGPCYLVLGHITDLDPLLAGPGSFQPSEEDLDDLDEDTGS